MNFQQSYNVTTSLINNEIRVPLKKDFQFMVNVQNLTGKKGQPIFITLIAPREVHIASDKRKNLGSIPSRGVKQCIFKIKGKKEGIFDLRLEIVKENIILTNILLRMFVGQQQTIEISKKPLIQQQPVIQKNSKPKELIEKVLTKKCPFCEELIEESSVFCPICGVELDRK